MAWRTSNHSSSRLARLVASGLLTVQAAIATAVISEFALTFSPDLADLTHRTALAQTVGLNLSQFWNMTLNLSLPR